MCRKHFPNWATFPFQERIGLYHTGSNLINPRPTLGIWNYSSFDPFSPISSSTAGSAGGSFFSLHWACSKHLFNKAVPSLEHMLRIFIFQITDLHIYSLNIYERLSGKTATQWDMCYAYTSYTHVCRSTYTGKMKSNTILVLGTHNYFLCR